MAQGSDPELEWEDFPAPVWLLMGGAMAGFVLSVVGAWRYGSVMWGQPIVFLVSVLAMWWRSPWDWSPPMVVLASSVIVPTAALGVYWTFAFDTPVPSPDLVEWYLVGTISIALVGGVLVAAHAHGLVPELFWAGIPVVAVTETSPTHARELLEAVPRDERTDVTGTTVEGSATPADDGATTSATRAAPRAEVEESGGRSAGAGGTADLNSPGSGTPSGSTAGSGSSSTGPSGAPDPTATPSEEHGTTAEPRVSNFDATYDDFDVGDVLGSGGNADVHLATIDLPSGEHEVALKTPRIAGARTVDAAFFEQFREEAETWDRLDDHGHVVTVHDWGETPHPWIAMEHMEAGDLNAWRDRLDDAGKFAALTDVAEAVHHAHTHGVNHTDLKPGNVLFTERADPWVAKVGDWGLANVLLEPSESVEGFTPDYAAPEQVDPEEFGRTDHRTDVYQLGLVAYELLTGELPFEKGHQAATINAIMNEDPEPPTAVNPDLPPAVDDALLRALSKAKADRLDAVVYLRDAFRDLA